jgi:hypothetical protein
LERAGQGHTCRSIEPLVITPSTGWVVGTWVVVGFAVLYVAFALLLGKVALGLPTSGEVPAGRLAAVLGVSPAWLVILAGTVISQVVWNRSTRRLAERYGFDGNLVVRQWFVRVYAATIVVTVFLEPLLGLSDQAGVVLVTVVRATAGLVLLANVLVGRSRLLRLIADSARQSQEAPSSLTGAAEGMRLGGAGLSDDELEERWGRIAPE